MLSLYEILKASKTGIAPDMWTALAGANFGGAGSGAEVKELTGIPPLSFTANGTPLLDFLISGNTVQSGTPTPDSPIMPEGTGERTGNLLNLQEVADAYPNDTSFDGTTFDIYGGTTAKKFEIISEKYEAIADDVHKIVSRGSTLLNVTGGFTGIEKKMLVVVVSEDQYSSIKEIIEKHDPSAFVIISDTKDVNGEGFTYEPRM